MLDNRLVPPAVGSLPVDLVSLALGYSGNVCDWFRNLDGPERDGRSKFVTACYQPLSPAHETAGDLLLDNSRQWGIRCLPDPNRMRLDRSIDFEIAEGNATNRVRPALSRGK